ncbi:hypothetical protein ASE02_11435 [Phenylobacterium sp. Root700]|nr:hypothetical protein [Phenylobacterium sp. Root700]KRB52592.1 hypothetical protein ASE02_11435 [Phenylobacterium sp. Root700]
MTAQSFTFERHAIMIFGQFKTFDCGRLQRAAQQAQGARRRHDDQPIEESGLGPELQRLRDAFKEPRFCELGDIFITSAMTTEPEPIVDSGALTVVGLLAVFSLKPSLTEALQGPAPPPLFVNMGLATIGRDNPSDFIHGPNLLT